MHLRTKTSLLLAATVTVAVALSGVLMLRELETAIGSSVTSGLENLAEANAQAIARFLDDSLRDVQAIAQSLPQDAVNAKDAAAIERHLESLSAIYPQFENGMFVLDASGRFWTDYPPNPEKRGGNFAFREYFTSTLSAGRGVVGEPYRSSRSGEPVVTFTALLRDSAGAVVGVLGCSVRLLAPTALGGIRDTRIGETGYLYVYDTTRLMVLHPKDERVLTRDVPPGANVLFDAAIEGFEGTGETVNSRGVAMLLALKQVPGTHWILGVQQPQAEAFAPLRHARVRLAAILLLAVFAAVLIGERVVRRITAPLEALREAAMRLGRDAGQATAAAASTAASPPPRPAIPRSSDEIADLSHVFGDMTQRLESTLAALRRSDFRWERTFDVVPEALLIADPAGVVQRVNRAAERLWHVTRGDLLGTAYARVLGPGAEDWVRFLDRALAAREAAAAELPGPAGTGVYAVAALPVTGDRGKFLGILHLARDISVERKAQETQRCPVSKLHALN